MDPKLIELRLDGVTVQLPQSAAELVNRAIADRDAKITKAGEDLAAATKLVSEQQARADGLTEQLTATKKLLEDAPAKVRAEVESRLKLEGQVKAVLGAEYETTRTDDKGARTPKTDREMREAVIRKLRPNADLTGKDDVYMTVRFDSCIEEFGQSGGATNVRSALFPTQPKEVRQDGGNGDGGSTEPDPMKSRAAMMQSDADAWKPKTN